MNQTPAGQQKPYTLTIDSRARAVITGVERVRSFDERRVELDTCGGRLVMTGAALHVESLQPEQSRLTVTGEIAGAVYEEHVEHSRRGFLRQLWGGNRCARTKKRWQA